MIKIKEPFVIKDVLCEEEFKDFSDYLFNKSKKPEDYDSYFGRYSFREQDPYIEKVTRKLIPVARAYFESENLLPSYSMFAHYEGEKAKLHAHVDDNACTYTLDMCVYQNKQWDLYVDDKPYTLNPNQALAYYGNDQKHWREKFPDPENQYVAMIFFHFVEPDHWWFTKGPSYINVIRGNVTEDQWMNKNLL